MSKYQWDRNSIREYREKHEPYSKYEKFMMETLNDQGTKVKAKVGKNSNADVARRQLEKKYPDAEIEIEGGKKEPLIREISTKKLKPDKEKEKRE